MQDWNSTNENRRGGK